MKNDNIQQSETDSEKERERVRERKRERETNRTKHITINPIDDAPSEPQKISYI